MFGSVSRRSIVGRDVSHIVEIQEKKKRKKNDDEKEEEREKEEDIETAATYRDSRPNWTGNSTAELNVRTATQTQYSLTHTHTHTHRLSWEIAFL